MLTWLLRRVSTVVEWLFNKNGLTKEQSRGVYCISLKFNSTIFNRVNITARVSLYNEIEEYSNKTNAKKLESYS